MVDASFNCFKHFVGVQNALKINIVYFIRVSITLVVSNEHRAQERGIYQ